MTRPKFRPCPSCQTPNQASRKSCYVCFGSLSTKQKIKDKVVSLDSQWGQSVVNSRNTGRIFDSARIAVRKLEAVGYKPILFIGKQNKKASNKWVADIITHLHPTPVTRNVLEKMQRAYEFILTKSTSTAQQLDNESPIAEQHNSYTSILELESLTVELPESLTVEQPERLTVKQESLTMEQPERLTVKQESLTVEQPERLTVKQESLTVELPESLTMEQPERLSVELSESLTVEQPERLTVKQESLTMELSESLKKESETVFILNFVPLSSPRSPTSLSPPSSTTFTAVLPPHFSPPLPPLPCSKSLQKRKKRTKTSICSPAPSATSVSPPSLIPTDLSLSQEGPRVKKRRKGCRKCSRQKIFPFDKITGERINEGKAELKVHWLPCTVCGKTWDDTWEPANELQHFLPESSNPSQLSP